MCKVKISPKDIDDLYFIISNTILSYEKPCFTINEIKDTLSKKKIDEIFMHNIKNTIKACVDKLIETGRVSEEPRVYKIIGYIDGEK